VGAIILLLIFSPAPLADSAFSRLVELIQSDSANSAYSPTVSYCHSSEENRSTAEKGFKVSLCLLREEIAKLPD